jgi:hypothetical protein
MNTFKNTPQDHLPDNVACAFSDQGSHALCCHRPTDRIALAATS